MAKFVCPSCQTHAVPSDGVEPVRCQMCGARLPAATVGGSAESANDDDSLVAELREAFGLGTHGLRRAKHVRRGTSAPTISARTIRETPGSLMIGNRVGDFEILGELGRGGMGIVFRARQLSLDRQVALKILPGAVWRSGEAVSRFHREAQAAARLNHANVVPVYAQGEHDGSYYYAMKLVEGLSLAMALKTHPEMLSSKFVFRSSKIGLETTMWTREASSAASGESPDGATDHDSQAEQSVRVGHTADDFRYLARLVAGVADGLAHAHDNGVIHRDIKPHNLILGEGQRLYITDFGLAYLRNEPHLTVTGEVMGTPSYLAPEQIHGQIGAVDHRADVYSVGVTLYELITGRRPFIGETRDQILHAICSETPSPPRTLDSRIPVDLETICLRAMEKEVDRRYPSAGMLAAELRRFADRMPILSRRVGRLEKAVKWARRHKAVTTAALAMMAAVAISVGWAVSAAGVREREAREVVQSVYSRLVHRGYQRDDLVAKDIERAAALGGETTQLRLVRALARLTATDQASAMEDLTAVLEEEPGNLQAWYILAWARWRDDDLAGSREALRHAEELGSPRLGEDWYFRGLAVHFDDAEAAIDSYRKANVLGTINGEFFPQAALHLARAHNQQMYATRTIDSLTEAESSIKRLIENQQYGAFPYYLLSITYRLAAEIYEGSSGVRGDGRADDYFAKALLSAREGQGVDPTNDRPVTAEAECLERMGRWHDAIEARNRAIDLAYRERGRCEGYHYRWRLHYWVGNLDEALGDIASHTACMPESPFYAHVYPALVYAELGDMDRALSEARALSEEAPDDAWMVLWSATCLRLLGETKEANELLLDRIDAVDFAIEGHAQEMERWLDALYAFSAGQATFDALEGLASEAQRPWMLRGEAEFHAAAKALGEGRREEAMERFSRSYRSFDGALNYTFHSLIVFEKLRGTADWPPWIPSTPRGAAEHPAGARARDGVIQSAGVGEVTDDAEY